MPRRRKLPGYRWRTLAWDESKPEQPPLKQEYDGTESVRFDELVIDDWFHMEQMDDRIWWACVGDMHFNILVRHDGRVEINGWMDRGRLEVHGCLFRTAEDAEES